MDSLVDNYDTTSDAGIISETAEYSVKSDFSKARVIESMIMKCIDLGSKEMKQGYYNYIVKNDVVNKVWVSDTREEFIGAVRTLRDLLSPELDESGNEMYKDKALEIQKRMKEVFEKYAYKNNDGTLKMPFIDEALEISKEKNINGMQIIVKDVVPGAWNNNINLYKNELVILYRELFSLLNKLIHAKNYFKKGLSF